MREVYRNVKESKEKMKSYASQVEYIPHDDARVIAFCLNCDNEKCNGEKCTALKLYEHELRSEKCKKNLRSKI